MLRYAILAGAVAGLGVALIVRELIPSHPELGTALNRLHASPLRGDDRPRRDAGDRRSTMGHALGTRLRELAEHAGLGVPRRELDLIGQTVESFLITKLALTLLGLAFPPALAVATGLIGLRLPVAVPAAGSLALATVLFFVPDLDARRRTAQARREFRRAVCSYIDLVALERLADAGAVEALERAAEVGGGWVFARIRDTLVRAQLAGMSPWTGLNALADEVGVPELADVGDIVRLSGEDGAAVYQTLRARARALRAAILAQQETEANAASEKLIVPVACLGLAFIALLVYPAFARILFGD
jgi:Flp pilus assembly protein TadB